MLNHKTKAGGYTKSQIKLLAPFSIGDKWLKGLIGVDVDADILSKFESKKVTQCEKKHDRDKAVKLKRKNQSDKQKEKILTNKAFFKSRRWMLLRYEAFEIHGRQCLCCGAKPPQVVIHVDHIKPRSLYPELELDIDNLQILCEECNLGKSNLYNTDYRTSPKSI